MLRDRAASAQTMPCRDDAFKIYERVVECFLSLTSLFTLNNRGSDELKQQLYWNFENQVYLVYECRIIIDARLPRFSYIRRLNSVQKHSMHRVETSFLRIEPTARRFG
jgi:hypothetical protein